MWHAAWLQLRTRRDVLLTRLWFQVQPEERLLGTFRLASRVSHHAHYTHPPCLVHFHTAHSKLQLLRDIQGPALSREAQAQGQTCKAICLCRTSQVRPQAGHRRVQKFTHYDDKATENEHTLGEKHLGETQETNETNRWPAEKVYSVGQQCDYTRTIRTG